MIEEHRIAGFMNGSIKFRVYQKETTVEIAVRRQNDVKQRFCSTTESSSEFEIQLLASEMEETELVISFDPAASRMLLSA